MTTSRGIFTGDTCKAGRNSYRDKISINLLATARGYLPKLFTMIEENTEGLANSNLAMVLDAYFESFNKALIDNLIAKWQVTDGVFDEDGLVSAFIFLHKTVHSSIDEYEIFLQESFGSDTSNLNSFRKVCAQINQNFNDEDRDFLHCQRLYGTTPDQEIKRLMGEYYKNLTVNYLQTKSQEISSSLNLSQAPYQRALIDLEIINPEVTEILSEAEQAAKIAAANDNLPAPSFSAKTIIRLDSRDSADLTR